MNISQAAEKTGLSAKQIRDYEKAGLLPEPSRTESGYRFYNEKDLARLHFICNARKVGFSLVQITALLKLNDNPNRCSCEVKKLTEQHIVEIEQKIDDLQSMLKRLKSWSQACGDNNDPECSILNGLNG